MRGGRTRKRWSVTRGTSDLDRGLVDVFVLKARLMDGGDRRNLVLISRNKAEAECDTHEQRKRGGFGYDGKECADFGRA